MWNRTIPNPHAKVGSKTLIVMEIRGGLLDGTTKTGIDTIAPIARFMNPLKMVCVNPLI